MKGVVFNLFEQFVTENWGFETYEKLVAATELETDGPFVGPGTYPDADLFALVGTACSMLEVSAEDALRAFGRFAFAGLVEKAGPLVEGIDCPKEFLQAVDRVVHVEVRKVYSGARPPRFLTTDTGPGSLSIKYQSPRKLCALVEGLLEATGTHFDTSVEFEHATCMHAGAECCEFHVEFAKVSEPVA